MNTAQSPTNATTSLPSQQLSATRGGEYWISTGPPEARCHSFVQWDAPETDTGKLPVILVHGGGGQSTDWTVTPDGRPGWAPLLIDRGFEVHLPDRPAHGRSPYDEEVHGTRIPAATAEVIGDLFAPSEPDPRTALHTKWPWTRTAGGMEFDALLASTQPVFGDAATGQRLDADMLTALIDRTGPSIIITHSAGAPAGWLAADRRPNLVKALVAVEPLGPPRRDLGRRGGLDFGLTSVAPSFEPPVSSPIDPSNPARLPGLSQVPVAVVSTDASGRRDWDDASVRFLRRTGVEVDHIFLPDHHLSGYGHGVIFELHNERVLDVVQTWFEAAGNSRTNDEGNTV
ncbi:alpha/beta fold hydrolase [Rhodococcus sp. IEGM 1370]|uniref:alpha/beta fold hydrolase n=1 Tax=Rhodococcus sp. IEGM 1370 TaxID=3082222 RepID=UPI002952CE07|nr:alpha/beta fold hydrolase [Rhodococcus sp. IEGM 1370]MDV8079745.1 alpha/beta fold hydrolase [Rhodococcus sp. IEGM 1370]